MCRELEKWSMEERIEDEAARKALYKEYQHRLKKSPEAIEIVDSIRGFFYIKPNNIFSRDFW